MKWIGLLLMTLTLAAPAGAAACPGTRHAVVIGIDTYQHGVPRLRGARRDAERVAKALKAQGFEVTMLLDEQATRDRLRQVLGDGLLQTKPDDQVLIYFAGHGETIGQAEPMGYLVPVDGRADGVVTTGLSMSELVGWMNAYPARQRLFIADACYSGLALPSAREIRLAEPKVDQCPAADLPVTAAIVAGRRGDKAHESGAGGLFTQTLLKVLRGETTADPNGDGWISHTALGGYLGEVVAGEAKARYGVQQVPQVAGRGDGRFMLRAGRPKSSAPVEERVAAGAEVAQPRLLTQARPRTDATAQVRAALTGAAGTFAACFDSAPKWMRAQARVDLGFTLDRSGRVGPPKPMLQSGAGRDVVGCLADALRALKLPPLEGAHAFICAFTPKGPGKLTPTGTLSVSSRPAGLRVSVGESSLGRTPVAAYPLPPGERTVSVEAAHHTVNIQAGKAVKLVYDRARKTLAREIPIPSLRRPSEAPSQ